jgi:hypothetical protein
MRYKSSTICCVVVFIIFCLFLPSQVLAKEDSKPSSLSAPEKLILGQAVMCEGIEASLPKHTAIVFSVKLERIFCFTSFDSVSEEIFISHNWFFKDKLVTKRKLTLKPLKWSTFSAIQLREADKGPWRVEITGPAGNIFKTLRFSVTD